MVEMPLVIKVERLAIQPTPCLCLIIKVLCWQCPPHKKDNIAAANRHDVFEIQTLFNEICTMLKEAAIDLDGLFLKADPGFDSDSFRQACEKENIIANVKPNLVIHPIDIFPIKYITKR
jgi:hypothetical protein